MAGLLASGGHDITRCTITEEGKYILNKSMVVIKESVSYFPKRTFEFLTTRIRVFIDDTADLHLGECMHLCDISFF